MKYSIITLFPEMFAGPLSESIIRRALEEKIIEIEYINLRDFGIGSRKQVDDTPYGGGAGMVLKVDVVARAIEVAKKDNKDAKVILLTPQGELFEQKLAEKFARDNTNLILICGHYEGFDERIRSLANREVSIGKYVLTGGEIPAMAMIDTISRLIPGVLGKEESLDSETFDDGNNLEYPQYTRPEEWRGDKVPEVLLSGDHEKIKQWRSRKSEEKTKKMLEKNN